MSKKQQRRRFTSEQKASILGEHLFAKKPISEVCDAHGLQPSVVYGWQRRAQAHFVLALEGSEKRTNSRERELEAKMAQMEATLAKKTEVIAEIAEELVTLKKSAGER